jgi:hypothetical protein
MSTLMSSVLLACYCCWLPCWNSHNGRIMVIDPPHTVPPKAVAAHVVEPVEVVVTPPAAREAPGGAISPQTAQSLLQEWEKAVEARDLTVLRDLYANPSDARKWSSIVSQSSDLSADLSIVELSGDLLAFDCNLAYRLGGKGGVWKKRYAWQLAPKGSGLLIVGQNAL